MLRAIRNAYGSGYRAGMCGADYMLNPYRNLILRITWDNGWHTGMLKQLNQWLNRKKG